MTLSQRCTVDKASFLFIHQMASQGEGKAIIYNLLCIYSLFLSSLHFNDNAMCNALRLRNRMAASVGQSVLQMKKY